MGPQLGKGECKRCGAPRSYSSKSGLCRKCQDNPPDSGSPQPGPEFKRSLKPSVESKANLVVNKLIGLSENEEEFLDRMPGGLDLPPDDLPPEDRDTDGAEDLDTPEERTEVQIANDILAALDSEETDAEARLEQVRGLAQEILTLHGEGEEGELGPDGPDTGDDLGVPPDFGRDEVDDDERKTV